LDITNVLIPRACGNMNHGHLPSPLLWMIFGVKYEKKDNVEHLIASMKTTYRLTKDWTGNLYCGITLDWDYVNSTVDISIWGYIKKKLQEYNHVLPGRLQACPYTPAPKKFGAQVQTLLEVDSSPRLNAKGIKRVQQIVGASSTMQGQ
jgi:hypothetical protein